MKHRISDIPGGLRTLDRIAARGPTRPPRDPNYRRDVPLAVRLREGDRQRLHEIAVALGVTVNSIVRSVLDPEIDRLENLGKETKCSTST